MRRVRTRYAPSPTGPQHIGGLRTAIYCYLFAKKHHGDFILRIEDTDQNRFVPGAEEYLMESLRWAGVPPDEGQGVGGPHAPYKQSERKALYRKYADQLLESGHAYIAFDTSAELDAWRERMKAQGNPSPQYNNVTRQYLLNSTSLSADEVKARLERGDEYTIRFKMPRNEEVKFEDSIRGWVSVNTNQLDDKVLFKSDGMPTYHLANVVDDYLMEISHVIRGEEWLPSAPLHVLLYRAFGWEEVMPNFSHLPLMLRPDGNGKLSKRDGDRLGFPVFPLDWTDPETNEKSSGFREIGFLPEAVLNFLAFCGWNPGTEQEIFSKDELIEAFTLERVSKSGARFDWNKVKWYNQQYIKTITDETIAKTIAPKIAENGWKCSEAKLIKYVSLVRDRAVFINEIPEIGYYFFTDIREFDLATAQKKWKSERKDLFVKLSNQLSALETFDAANAESLIKNFLHDNSLGMGEVMPILRIALCGTMQGPPVFDLMEWMGKEMSIHRIDTFIQMLK